MQREEITKSSTLYMDRIELQIKKENRKGRYKGVNMQQENWRKTKVLSNKNGMTGIYCAGLRRCVVINVS